MCLNVVTVYFEMDTCGSYLGANFVNEKIIITQQRRKCKSFIELCRLGRHDFFIQRHAIQFDNILI